MKKNIGSAKEQKILHKKPSISRRNFLKYGLEAGAMVAVVGGLKCLPGKKTYARPPGALEPLYERCIKCGACIEACPTHALELLDLGLDFKNIGTPVLNPVHGGCIAWQEPCLACIDICPANALVKPENIAAEKIGIAAIDGQACVNCMLCFLKCPVPGAVLFPNPHGAPFERENDIPILLKKTNSPIKPYINEKACVGCGLCAFYCPVRVISIKGIENR